MGRPPLPIGSYGEITTHERAGKTYAKGYFRHTDGKTRPHEKQGKTAAAAKRNLRALFATWQDTSNDVVNGQTRVRAVSVMYFEKIEERVEAGALSPNSLRLYRSAWTNHLEKNVADLALAEVTTQRVETVLHHISAASPDTAKTARAVLGGIMRIAKRYDAIPSNPMHDVESPPAAKRGEPKALEPEQVADLLVVLSASKKARRRALPDIVLWMLATSERIGNALAPRWSRIDLAAATADLGPNVIRVNGVGLVIQGDDVSTKTRSRTVGLPSTAVRMLRARELVADVAGEDLDDRFRQSHPRQGLVFPNARGTGPLDPQNVSRALRSALDETGYEWVTSHVFRKTVASTLDAARLTPREISDRLGHARTSITQDDYMKRRADSPAVTAALEAMLTTPASVTELRRPGA